MKNLNIAFYTDAYLPGVDGVVTSILTFKDELEKRGHKVYIFASADSKNKKKYGRKDVFLYTGLKFRPYPQYNVALFPYNSVIKLNELKIDLIHAQTPMVMGFAGLMASKLLNKPLISSFHTLITNKPIVDAYYPKNKHLKRFATSSVLRYTKFFYNRCDRVIAPSESINKMLRRYGISNVETIPNAIDLSRFNTHVSGSRMRKSLGIKPRQKIVLYLGRLSREKKIEVLFKAARILMAKDRNLVLVVGGTGPAENHYKSLARKLGIMERTMFIGFVGRKELPRLYAAADVFCLPSTFETQGVVLLEAMATGKPVVGADYLAISEMVVNGKNGEKFKPGDYTDCAKKIEKVLNNTGHYKHEAVRTASEFSKEKVTDRLLDVYYSVL